MDSTIFIDREKFFGAQSLFLSNRFMLNHGVASHPENSKRLESIYEALEESFLYALVNMSIERLASVDELLSVHDLAYIHHVFSFEGKKGELDSETLLSEDSVRAARLAVGIGLELVENIVLEKFVNGFALIRPPGHHARPCHGMGFCIFNNIAIAAKKAISMGIKRILILDWDVHHGNGTQEVFYHDEKVLFIDLHQDNLFPKNSGSLKEVGLGNGLGFNMNLPLSSVCGDVEYAAIFDSQVKPQIYRYNPELILVSAGFDAHESDPMGFMKVTTKGYRMLAEKVKQLADEVCGGKLAFFLEGGYNPFYLAKNVIQCMEVLLNESKIS